MKSHAPGTAPSLDSFRNKTRFSRFHVLSRMPAVLTLFVIIRLVIVSTNVLIILIKYDTANILCARTLKRSL